MSSALGQVTERVSLTSSGAQANFGGDLPFPARFVTADGRYVVFRSGANNLVPGDTNVAWDVFVRDRLAQTTERSSVSTASEQANGPSGLLGITISRDGRYVAFETRASNLVPGDTNFTSDIVLRDRLNGTTERLSVSSSGAQGDGQSFYPSFSADVRYVAFTSDSSNLVPGDTNGRFDVFVRGRWSGTTERVSLTTAGIEGNRDSYKPVISADGRFVALESDASNLVVGDTNARWDIFVRDRVTDTTERVSVGPGGLQGNDISVFADISHDGRFVAFNSLATNLVPGDTNEVSDVFVHDRRTGMTELVSLSTAGTLGDRQSGTPSISGDGRFVAFYSSSTNLIAGDSHGADVFVRDRLNGTTERVSVSMSDDLAIGGSCDIPSISEDGRYVVFRAAASNLVPGDTNTYTDVFIHDRSASGFTSLCEPGADGVAACPCGNTPLGPGRGCDNSSATGGASLSAAGIAYLSIDSLRFTASGEGPNAPSTLVQSSSPSSAGVPYGQGVRCGGGSLTRLFTRRASAAGTVTLPDLQSGDPTTSERSAAHGDMIRPGQSRWYFVHYRDPVVLGGCSPIYTFNATQAGRVTWWP